MTFYETGLVRMQQTEGYSPDATRRLKLERLGWVRQHLLQPRSVALMPTGPVADG